MLVFPEWPNAPWYPIVREVELRSFLVMSPCFLSPRMYLRPKLTPLYQGMRKLTTDDRQRLLRQASAAYKTAHREQQEAGINVFTPTEFTHFETNEEVPLDP